MKVKYHVSPDNAPFDDLDDALGLAKTRLQVPGRPCVSIWTEELRDRKWEATPELRYKCMLVVGNSLFNDTTAPAEIQRTLQQQWVSKGLSDGYQLLESAWLYEWRDVPDTHGL